jgi:hypothetical protein
MNGNIRYKNYLQPIGASPSEYQASAHDALVVVIIFDRFIGILLADGTSGR